MKKRTILTRTTALMLALMTAAFMLTACGSAAAEAPAEEAAETEETAEEPEAEEAEAEDEAAEEAVEPAASGDVAEPAKLEQEAEAETEEAGGANEAGLEDGVYDAVFTTDSSMFHVNEACEGKGVLTVENGEMTIHISLVSKNILNLYPGLAEDAEKEGAELLEPTTDEVTYSDGITEEVYGFDVPVPVIGEEFDLAIIGSKGKWYDHKVMVTDPVPQEG